MDLLTVHAHLDQAAAKMIVENLEGVMELDHSRYSARRTLTSFVADHMQSAESTVRHAVCTKAAR